MIKSRQAVSQKLRILKYAEKIDDDVKTCRYFGIGRIGFYHRNPSYEQHSEAGVENRSV
jgi:hypothetical protein